MDHTAIQAEVDKNYQAFQKLLPELIEEHNERFALMRGEKVVHVFDSVHDAVVFAKEKYDDDLFSVQNITERVIDLGAVEKNPMTSEGAPIVGALLEAPAPPGRAVLVNGPLQSRLRAVGTGPCACPDEE